MQEYLGGNFNPDYIRNKSGAAAGLCGWVVNICKYFRIYQARASLLRTVYFMMVLVYMCRMCLCATSVTVGRALAWPNKLF